MFCIAHIVAEIQDSEVQLAISQLFASPLCERVLANTVREKCSARLTIARDILLLLSLLHHQGKVQTYAVFVVFVLGDIICLCCASTLSLTA